MGKKNERKRLLINPTFQLKFLGWMLSGAIGVLSIFYTSNLYFLWELQKLGKDIGLPIDHTYFEFVQVQSGRMNQVFVLSAVVTLLIITIFSLILSHRIAGPIHHLKTYFQRLSATGKARQKLFFRKSDFFHEVPENINRFLFDEQKTEQKTKEHS